VKHDITKPIYFGDVIDYIFHLASPASPIDYLDLPIQTLKVGALGTYNMLGLAKEQKARFLLASTSEIYGDPLVNPIGPRGVYDEAKRYAEAITMAYHNSHGIDTRIVVSLIHMDPECVQMTVGLYRTLLIRLCRVRILLSMGRESRRGRSAMCLILLMGYID
jgi:nucleoside-diphosphate-sugar epimerase